MFSDLRPSYTRMPDEKINVTHLPDELLLQIFGELSTSDLLRLRWTSQHFLPPCSTLVAKRRPRLYIHPSIKSLRQVIKVCDHPIFNQEITEIVLLGKVFWKQIDHDWPEYRFQAEQRYSKGKEFDWYRRFRPWPLIFPRSTTSAKVVGQAAQLPEHGEDFREAYATLIEALHKLLKLKKLSFADKAEYPGFNPTAEQQIETFAKNHAQPSRWKSRSGDSLTQKKGCITERADAEVLFGLLFDSGLSFTELAIRVELPFIGHLLQGQGETIDTRSCAFSAAQTDKLAQLTSIELYSDSGWKTTTKWHYFCQAVLACAKQLEHLSLVYKHNKYHKKVRDEWSTRLLLHEGQGPPTPRCWPKLKSFRLISQSLQADDKVSLRSRPISHALDIEAFITAHATTLDTVELGAVAFVNAEPQLTPAASVRAGLEALEVCEKLKDVSWTVNYFRHDSRCPHADEAHFSHCSKYECGHYCAMYRRAVSGTNLEDIEALAEELSVGLDEDGRAWDFGTVARRRIGG